MSRTVCALGAALMLALVSAAPLAAATPSPHATRSPASAGFRRTSPTHPAPPVMNGTACTSGPAGLHAQQHVNPITGVKEAPLVEVPVQKHSDVANATARAQAAANCAHGH